jgi:hypothetical protein
MKNLTLDITRDALQQALDEMENKPVQDIFGQFWIVRSFIKNGQKRYWSEKLKINPTLN